MLIEEVIQNENVDFSGIPSNYYLLGLLSAFENRFQAMADNTMQEIKRFIRLPFFSSRHSGEIGLVSRQDHIHRYGSAQWLWMKIHFKYRHFSSFSRLGPLTFSDHLYGSRWPVFNLLNNGYYLADF